MSNLGLYQTMTTVAGAIGGPVVLIAATLGAGYLAGKGIEKLAKKVKNSKNRFEFPGK